MEKYDPYNPNNLDELFNKKKIEINKNDKKKLLGKYNDDNDIGMNILKKMGWKGKGILSSYLYNLI